MCNSLPAIINRLKPHFSKHEYITLSLGKICEVAGCPVILWWRRLPLTSRPTSSGALDGGSPCRLSILRNANVACLCRLFKAMSPVGFKKCQSHMSLYFLKPCHMSISSMSRVEFKKQPCRPVDFRGRGPFLSTPKVTGELLL